MFRIAKLAAAMALTTVVTMTGVTVAEAILESGSR